ncbi:hypothetical protein D3OALGB2SA_2114 [Olavius algarvensis associated proteobacterium Delta 3]|nr:hypothetical protein D3OALGB2SA_2114 [Olavius algarvensis associated proteobacterium Delta 3]
MKRPTTQSIVAVFLVFVLVPVAGGQSDPSPPGVWKTQEMAHSDVQGDIYLGRVMTLIYPAYRVAAADMYLPDLIQLADALKTERRKNYGIVLKGFTDNSGSPEGNLEISRTRAEALKQLLVTNPAMAIQRDRIVAEGYGASNPVATNDTFEGRQKNRRVEIHIYSSPAAARRLSDDLDVTRIDPGAQPSEPVLSGTRSMPSSVPESSPGPQPAPLPEASPGPEPALPADTVPLSLIDAIQYGMEGNQDIRVVSFTPRQTREELAGTESVFDAEVFADSAFRRDPNLQSSVTTIVTEDDGLVQTGIRKPLGTGGSISTALEMRYGNLNNADFDRVYRYTFAPTLEIRQPLLKNVGGREQRAAITIANYQVSISDEAFREKVLETVTRISRAYWQLFLLIELVKIDEQNFDMAEEVYRRESVRVAEGISQQLDVERARSNAHRRRGNLVKTKERFRVTLDQLKLLLNWSNLTIDSTVDIVPIDTPQTMVKDVDEQEAIDIALKHRPEIERARQRLEIRKVEETLSRHLRLPTLDVFGRYAVSGYGRDFSSAVDDTGINDNDAWAAGLNFAYPLGNRSAQARYRKKSLERHQASAQIKRVQNKVKQDVKEVLLAIMFAKGEIDSTKVAKDSAARVVEGEFARFEIGQTTNEELLRAQDLLAANSRNFVRAVINYNIALAELSRVQGVLPDGVSIEGSTWETNDRQ